MKATAPSAPREATYADVLAAPDNTVAEIVDGQLALSPRPASVHSHASSGIGGELFVAFGRPGGPGGWWILDEPELHLGRHVLVPDLAGWRRERMPVFPHVAAFTLAPDWVCEVLSPATAGLDRVRKFGVYLAERVQHLWFVDPLARTLEIYRNAGDHWRVLATHAGNDKVRAEPFEAVELDMTYWWPPEPAADAAPTPADPPPTP